MMNENNAQVCAPGSVAAEHGPSEPANRGHSDDTISLAPTVGIQCVHSILQWYNAHYTTTGAKLIIIS